MEKNLINAKLRGITVPVDIPDAEDANDLIVYCARVSNPANAANFETGEKLLNYCMAHKHVSVFEMANAVVEISAPRDIARQVLRHRSCSFQEFSQRYANANELGFVTREARKQHPTNRQMSIELGNSSDDIFLKMQWIRMQEEVKKLVQKNYDWALANGIAKECARVILPEGLTMSKMFINGNIRSWYHYMLVRCNPDGVQKEHVQLANAIYDVLVPKFPFLKEIKVV
jgi:thymidylate synthase (FAD)